MSTETKMFVVLRRGIYDQGLIGVFDTLNKAKFAANHAAYTDTDNYHTYVVLPYQLNLYHGHHNKTPPSVYSVNKDGPIVHGGEVLP